jgi:hypothetical protein
MQGQSVVGVTGFVSAMFSTAPAVLAAERSGPERTPPAQRGATRPRGVRALGAPALLLVLQAAAAPAPATAWDFTEAATERHVGDTTIVPTPRYLETIEDPFYGGRITLVTGTPGDPVPNLPGRTWGARNQPIYPPHTPWNADGSLLYLGAGRVFLDGATYEPVNLPALPWSSFWYWSPADPDIMVIETATGVAKWAVRRGAVVDSIDVPGFSDFSFHARGNMSRDGSRVGFKARRDSDGRYFGIGVDFATGEVGPMIDFAGWGFTLGGPDEWKSRAAHASPSGDYLYLGGYIDGHWNDTAHWFDWDTGEFVGRVPENADNECPGHGDLGVDGNGDDVLVGVCKGGLSWTGPYAGKTVALRLRDGAMWAVGPGSSHTSCRNTSRPGWCYGSTIQENSIIKANRLDGRRTEYYADAQDYAGSGYWDNSMGVPSPDGTKIAFTSTWNNTLNDPNGDARTFVLYIGHLAGS